MPIDINRFARFVAHTSTGGHGYGGGGGGSSVGGSTGGSGSGGGGTSGGGGVGGTSGGNGTGHTAGGPAPNRGGTDWPGGQVHFRKAMVGLDELATRVIRDGQQHWTKTLEKR